MGWLIIDYSFLLNFLDRWFLDYDCFGLMCGCLGWYAMGDQDFGIFFFPISIKYLTFSLVVRFKKNVGD